MMAAAQGVITCVCCKRNRLIALWCVPFPPAAEACAGRQQAGAGSGLLGVCHPGGGGMHRARTVPRLHPEDSCVCFHKVPGGFIVELSQTFENDLRSTRAARGRQI